MKLGDVIKNYIADNNLTIGGFSRRCGLSSTYITYLINGKTFSGSTPSPTLKTYKVCAEAMGMDVDTLIGMTDNISLRGYDRELSEATKYLLSVLQGASEEEIMQAAKIVQALKK